MKPGSDHCGKCAQISELLSTSIDKDTCTLLASSLENHKREATEEFKVYPELQREAREKHSTGSLHCLSDFAKKALLPYLLRQLGHLHFITGKNLTFLACLFLI